jgi:hypothetical protein
MKIYLHLWLIGLAFAPAAAQAADSFLVENGESRAEIIIAESPARLTRLAATDLQTYVEKISGARLPIKTKPSADVPVQIYVGEMPPPLNHCLHGIGFAVEVLLLPRFTFALSSVVQRY